MVAKAGDRLVINGENGKAQIRIVQSIAGRVITVTTAFDVNSIAVQNIWVLDAQDLATMKFRSSLLLKMININLALLHFNIILQSLMQSTLEHILKKHLFQLLILQFRIQLQTSPLQVKAE